MLTRACPMLLALVLAAGLGSTVAAGTSGPFTTSTPVPLTKTDWSSTLAFPKFNPALGQLTQVDISITAYLETILTVTNTASSASTGTAKTEVAVTVTDPLLLISMGPDFFSPNFAFSLAPGGSVTSGLLAKSATDSQSFTSAGILSEFTGPGTITMDADTFTQAWIIFNGGNSNVVQVTKASTTGCVTYHYTEVPELPASALALLPAAVGLLARIARRK